MTDAKYILHRFHLSSSQRSFLYRGIIHWNDLPAELRTISQLNTFKFKLKITYCQQHNGYLVHHWLSPLTLVLIYLPSFLHKIHVFCYNMHLNILCLSFQIYLFTCIHILLLYLINLRHMLFKFTNSFVFVLFCYI